MTLNDESRKFCRWVWRDWWTNRQWSWSDKFHSLSSFSSSVDQRPSEVWTRWAFKHKTLEIKSSSVFCRSHMWWRFDLTAYSHNRSSLLVRWDEAAECLRSSCSFRITQPICFYPRNCDTTRWTNNRPSWVQTGSELCKWHRLDYSKSSIINFHDENSSNFHQLRSPVEFTSIVHSIEIIDHPVKGFENCQVSGWGATEWQGVMPSELRKANVSIVSRELCSSTEFYDSTIVDGMVCANGISVEGITDVCQGGKLWILRGCAVSYWIVQSCNQLLCNHSKYIHFRFRWATDMREQASWPCLIRSAMRLCLGTSRSVRWRFLLPRLDWGKFARWTKKCPKTNSASWIDVERTDEFEQ